MPGKNIAWGRLVGASAALAIAEFAERSEVPLLVLAEDPRQADQLEAEIRYFVGQVFTSDFFHPPKNTEMWEELNTYNIPAVEMEIAGLYGVAAEYGAQAVAMCTVSDEVLTGKGLTVEERQLGFDTMIKVALDAIKNFD